MNDFVLPDYGGSALCNLLPGVSAALAGREHSMALPVARKYVLLLVDGLGYELLEQYRAHADHLARLTRRRLTCSIPSTTATSLTSLGCGRPPGTHGVVGYSFYDPTVAKVVNALTWENGPSDLAAFKQVDTVFESLGGSRSAAVTLERFSGSALTQLAFAGTRLVPRPSDENDVSGVVAKVRAALAEHDLVYCYERLLDHAGHSHGVGSWQWLEQLEKVDDLVVGLTTLTGDDVCLLVTGDHGMVNIPANRRIVAEDFDELAGFRQIAGEGRMRQLYCSDPANLTAAWQRFLGERAEVVRKEQAIERGWFGAEITERSAQRIGDVLVAMREDWAVMTRSFAKEFSMVGMHGSLTPAEMYVPLCVSGGVVRAVVG